MSLTIHFGVYNQEFPTLCDQFDRLIPNSPVRPGSYGGDWHDWSVKASPIWGQYDDSNEPIHVFIESTTPMVLLNFFVENFRHFFVPLNGEGYDGVCGKPEDEYVELRWPS
jgi:hypothetical protein